jgi:Tfp pilus assembly pilus retraction ATPase PilT
MISNAEESLNLQKKWAHIEPDQIVDWYLPEGNELGGRVVIEGAFVELSELPQCEAYLELVKKQLEALGSDTDFNLKVDWGKKSERRRHKYRGHRQASIEGDFIVLRKMPLEVPDLKTLGLPDSIKNLLMHEQLKRGGLIMICGEPGNGKSTTTAAMIRDRLKKYGGFCLTLENPVEMPLHGRHGQGYCLQTPVEEGDFERSLSSAMRCYPTAINAMLFLGEVRSAETAAEALRIANNGHLVITTLHASNVITCLKRILALAKTKNMSDDEATALLSSSLKLVLHQKLVMDERGQKTLATSFLFSPDNQSPVANRIRSGSIDNMVTEVEQQNQMLKVNQLQKQLDQWTRGTALD